MLLLRCSLHPLRCRSQDLQHHHKQLVDGLHDLRARARALAGWQRREIVSWGASVKVSHFARAAQVRASARSASAVALSACQLGAMSAHIAHLHAGLDVQRRHRTDPHLARLLRALQQYLDVTLIRRRQQVPLGRVDDGAEFVVLCARKRARDGTT